MIHVGQDLQLHLSVRAIARTAGDPALEPHVRPMLVVPLGNRLLEIAPLGEATAGFVVAATLLLVPLVRESLLGRLSVTLNSAHDLHVVIVESLLVGYLLAARAFTARSARTTLDELGDSVGVSGAPGGESVRSQIGRYPRLRFAAAGLIGATLGALTPIVIYDSTVRPWDLAHLTPEVAWRHFLSIVAGWLVATYLLVVIRESRRISTVARHLEDVNLFDSGSFAPFGRFGVQAAFTTVGFFSVISLTLIEHGFAVVVASVGTISALAAAFALLYPLRGLRERICQEKDRELACCRVALRSARDALVEGRMVTTEHGHLSEIVAYTRLVESVREWPLDAPTVLRVSSYALLPIASWLSGALGADLAARVVTMIIG